MARSGVLKAVDGSLPGFQESTSSRTWTAPFYFVQAADTQLGMMDNWGDGDPNITNRYPDVGWDREVDLCQRLVARVNQMRPRPRFLIVCGDLVDAMPEGWPEHRRKQEEDFFRVFQDLHPDVPLVCVCGNHDVGNEPTPDSVRQYRASFGDDYFAFWSGGVHFLVLNSQYYVHKANVETVAAEHARWLDEQLERSASSGRKHLVVFQHIPWFITDPHEPKEYFNIEEDIRMQMLRKLKDAGVSKIFCGHLHKNAGGSFEGMELVVTTAVGCQLGKDSHGARIVKVHEHQITHEFFAIDELPQSIEL